MLPFCVRCSTAIIVWLKDYDRQRDFVLIYDGSTAYSQYSSRWRAAQRGRQRDFVLIYRAHTSATAAEDVQLTSDSCGKVSYSQRLHHGCNSLFLRFFDKFGINLQVVYICYPRVAFTMHGYIIYVQWMELNSNSSYKTYLAIQTKQRQLS